MKGNTLPLIPPKSKKWEKEDPFRKNKHKHTEYSYIRCPKCNKVVTYKNQHENATKVCPWCKHFFTPAFNMRPVVIPFWITESPTDWDDI